MLFYVPAQSAQIELTASLREEHENTSEARTKKRQGEVVVREVEGTCEILCRSSAGLDSEAFHAEAKQKRLALQASASFSRLR
jgi:hypothetical protein